MIIRDITGIIYDDLNKTLENINKKQLNTLLQEGFLVIDEERDKKVLENCRKEIQEPYISTAYFFLTKNCNLACKYCFEKQSEIDNSLDGIMNYNTLIAGLDFFQRLINLDQKRFSERKTIIFYGGEPFHNKKLPSPICQ